jgi:hypothetical protein
VFTFALEFDSQEELEAALRRLRQQLRVTGEFRYRPLEGGRGWRLTVHAEKALRDATVERLGGKRVDIAG